jgi:salicylate hydroxylase
VTVLEKPKVLIAGAGLGGMAAAGCLLQKGYHVRVFEQAAELGELGAGIHLSANAVKVLWHLGLADDLEKIGSKPKAYVFRLFQSGEILQTFALGEEHYRLNGAPYYHFHRADLHDLLVRRVQQLDPEAVALNSTAEAFTQTGSTVVLHLGDGRREEGDLLIGADGIKSVIREQILGATEAHFTGDTAWRVLVPQGRLGNDFMDRVMTVWVGPGAHAVTYYVRGGDLLNFVGLVENPNWKVESWIVKSDWSEMRNDFSAWNSDIQRIIDNADKDQCYRWALFDRPNAERWNQGHVTLLGDSAHPMLPYLAQGAVMAIEDAAVLTRCLDRFDSIEEAFDVYQRNRIPRTSRVVDESTANGKLFHLKTEESFREAFGKRKLGAERNQWLYNYDPLSVELV